MIDLGPLEQKLTAPASRKLGTDDPAINEILALAEHNDFQAAAERSQKLWEQGVYDVRTLGCYLGGAFMERGLSALPAILDCLLKALTLNFEELGPDERKQRLCDVSLRWLFTTLLTQIDFHHRAKDATWERWNEGWTQAAYKEAVERCVQLAMLLDDVIPQARCRGPLVNLQLTLDGIVRPSNETAGWRSKMASATVIPAPLPPPDEAPSSDSGNFGGSQSSDDASGLSFEDAADETSEASGSSKSAAESDPAEGEAAPSEGAEAAADELEAGAEDDAEDSARAAADGTSSTDGAPPKSASAASSDGIQSQSRKSARLELPPPGPTGESISIPLSPALRALMRELAAFSELAQAGQIKKAAILYHRIEQQIARFDPRFYLPSLFGAFYVQLARHGARLKAQLDEPKDLSSAALVELSRVDLELFLTTDLEN